MEKPTELAFSDYATFRFFRAEIIFFIVFILLVLMIARVSRDDPLSPVTLSEAVMSGLCLVWVGVFAVGAWGYRLWEKFLIKRMFEGAIWECWQISSLEWEANVDAVCNQISPKDEGREAYSGVIASSIIGFILAVLIYLVTIFAIDQPVIKTSMRFAAVGLFIFMIGVGLFQPLVAKNEAKRYRRKALKIREPRVWFGPTDLYHETLGHTSLKELYKVTDQTKSRKRIQFTLEISSGDSFDTIRVPAPVPSGCEGRAGDLVRRYREERLHSQS